MNYQLQSTKLFTTISLVMLMLLFSVTANAITYTVSKTADTNDGTCDADCSLREAIVAANGTAANDVIEFSVTGTITLGGTELSIANNGSLTINGPTSGTGVTVSGNNLSRVFNVAASATVEINNLTISNGSSTSDGGGIENAGMLTVNSSTISNNTAAGGGGGIRNASTGTLIVNNSTISTNTGGVGGGITTISTATINDSTISNNSATSTSIGGIANSASLTLLNTIVADSINIGMGPATECINTVGTVSATYSLIEDGSCITAGMDNNISGDPNLGPLQNNGGPTQTHALMPGSIALDVADPANFPPFDQRGNVRPADGNPLWSGLLSKNYRKNLLALAPDMGAFEALAPTAAPASISGRVMTSSRRAIARAIVQVTDVNGDILTTRTNHFGYYTFEDIEVGQTLIFNVYSRQYQFAPQIVNLEENLTDLNFIAEGPGQTTKRARKMWK